MANDDGITMKLEGLDALMSHLDDLSTKGAERAMRKAVRAGAEIAQAAIAERAPVKVGRGGILPDGALANDIVIKVKRSKDDVITATVGPDKLTSHVARWVEYGHRMVRGGYSAKTKQGTYRGPGIAADEDVPEHPFIRPAFESCAQQIQDVVTSTLATAIEAEAKRK